MISDSPAPFEDSAFTGDAPVSRRERRAQVREARADARAEARRDAQRRHAQGLAGVGADGNRSLRVAADARSAQDEAIRHLVPTRPALTLAFGAAALAAGGVTAGSLVWLWHGPTTAERWALAALAGVAVVGGVRSFRRAWWWVRPGQLIAALAVVAVIWAAFGVGMRTQVTVAGRPVAETSSEAQASRLSRELEADLYALAELDDVLRLSGNDARIRVADIEASKARFDEIARRWDVAQREGRSPTGFAPTVEATKNAAALGGRSAEAKLSATLNSDSAGALVADNTRVAFMAETLRAGQLLAQAATDAGVPLGPPAQVRE